MDFAFYRMVSAQQGVFTTAQALAHFGDGALRAMVRTGRWRRSRWRGVLVDGELPDSPELHVRAAALAVGGDLVACHATAAALWGFDVLGSDTMHFLGPHGLGNRRLPGIQVHPSNLGCDDAVQVAGVWCTPPARTACDIVRNTAPIDGMATLDAALRSRTCTSAELASAAEAMRGLRQVVRLRELVPHAVAEAESPMESRMRWRFIDGGLPAPTVQVQLTDSCRRHFLDTGWPDWRVGAEFDGLEAHMTREQLDADRDRHNWITEHRWVLLHFTAVDVYRRPDAMVRRTARALGIVLPP